MRRSVLFTVIATVLLTPVGRPDVRARGGVVVVAVLRRDPGCADARTPRARWRGDRLVVAAHAVGPQPWLGARRVRRAHHLRQRHDDLSRVGTVPGRRARRICQRVALAARRRRGPPPRDASRGRFRSRRWESPGYWSWSSAEPRPASRWRRRPRCTSCRRRKPRRSGRPSASRGRHAARRRHRFQHQVGRPRRPVRACRPPAMALLVSRHVGRCSLAVHRRRHAPWPAGVGARAPQAGGDLPPRHGQAYHRRRRERRRAAREGLSRRDAARTGRQPGGPQPAHRAGTRLLPGVQATRAGAPRCGLAMEGFAWALGRGVARRRHSRHSIPAFDRRRRARACAA